MNLYELSEEFMDVMARLLALEEAGEMPPEVVVDTLEGMAGEWDDKALNVAKWIATQEAVAAAEKEAEKRIADRRKAREARAERMRLYLLDQVRRVGRCPSDAQIAIGTRKSEAVVIDDQSALPFEVMRHIPESWEPDKIAIKAAIKSGESIIGARIEARQHLVIK